MRRPDHSGMAGENLMYCCPAIPDQGAPHPFMPGYWLASRGIPVQILCQGEPGLITISTPLGDVPAHRLGIGSAKFSFRLFCALCKARSHHGTAFLVHSHVCTPAAWVALSGVSRRRLIYYTQDFLEPGRHPEWEWFERRFARRAQWVISNEPNRARFLASHYRLRRMPTVVPTALPKAWPRPQRDQDLRNSILARLGRKDNAACRIVMHEGGYATVRCGRHLVEAFEHLPEDFVLVFTGMLKGSAAAQELDGLTKEAGLQSRVLPLERLTFEDLLRHTACCDLGILLYPNDGIGNFYQCPGRLTHYIGCGLPVVASDFPGLELQISKNDLGAVCNPESAEAIARAIRQVGDRPRPQLAQQAEVLKDLSRNELAYETNAWRIEEIVKSALKMA